MEFMSVGWTLRQTHGTAEPDHGTDFVAIDPEDEYPAVADTVGGQVIRLAASFPALARSVGFAGDAVFSIRDRRDNQLAERVMAPLGLLDAMLCAGTGSNGGARTLAGR